MRLILAYFLSVGLFRFECKQEEKDQVAVVDFRVLDAVHKEFAEFESHKVT